MDDTKNTKTKEFLTKTRFLKLSTVFMFLLVTVFTVAVFMVFLITNGSEPSSLVNGFFDFVKWEFAGLSLIKVSENLGNGKKDKTAQTIANYGADVLDDTAEFIRGVTETTIEDGDSDI